MPTINKRLAAAQSLLNGVEHLPGWLSPQAAHRLFQQLANDITWQQPQIQVFGRWHQIPRQQAWHGDADAHYQYANLNLTPQPWIPALTQLRQRLAEDCQQPFNSVLLNYYQHGGHSMGWHSDDEPELGPEPVIASVSLGATRSLAFRPRQGGRQCAKIALAHGDLLLMHGPSQALWQHQLPKRAHAGPRINLTFRHILGTPVS